MATMLQGLIQRALDERGWNPSRFAKEGGLKRANVYRLLDKPLSRMPDDDTIEGLARATQLPAHLIRLAAAQDIGVPVHWYSEVLDDPELKVVMASLMALPPEARRYFAEMINKYRAELADGRAVDLAPGEVGFEVSAEDVPSDGEQKIVTLITRRDDPAFREDEAAYRPGTTSSYERQVAAHDEAAETPDAPGTDDPA